jgi:hypothetical protein
MAPKLRTIDPVLLSSATSALALLEALLSRFPERSGAIVKARFGVTDGKEKTLEEIGRTNQITRERVRQIVDVIMKRAKESLSREAAHPLAKRVIEALRRRGGVAPIDAFVREFGNGNVNEEKSLTALLPVLPGIKCLKESKVHSAIVVTADFSLAEWKATIEVLKGILEKSGDVLTLDELTERYVERSGTAVAEGKDLLRSLIAPSTEIKENVFGRFGRADWSAIRPRGTRERAHLILKVMKKPLHFREIARLIDEHGLYREGRKTHPQTVHNELIKDKRFVLVGRGTYALTEWGYQPGTVREVLSSILKEHRAPMSREELLAAVMKVRQVKRSTVIINLNSFFTKVGKNIYTLK